MVTGEAAAGAVLQVPALFPGREHFRQARAAFHHQRWTGVLPAHVFDQVGEQHAHQQHDCQRDEKGEQRPTHLGTGEDQIGLEHHCQHHHPDTRIHWAHAADGPDVCPQAARMYWIVEQLEQPQVEGVPQLASGLPQPTDEQHDGGDMADQHGAWLPVTIDERARHGRSLCKYVTSLTQGARMIGSAGGSTRAAVRSFSRGSGAGSCCVSRCT